MSSSLVLTNSLICSVAIMLLLPLLRDTRILVGKRGRICFAAIVAVFIKMLVPYEFSFTRTLASKRLLPTVRTVEEVALYDDIKLKSILLAVWLIGALSLLAFILAKHYRTMRILSLLPENASEELIALARRLCAEKNITRVPKIVLLKNPYAPFIVGLRKPTIVLPVNEPSLDALSFMLLHELEHYRKRHTIIKAFTELTFVCYWWNPLIWKLRKEIIYAIELQADTSVIKELSKKDGYSYLATLVKLAKSRRNDKTTSLALSFGLKPRMIERRVHTCLDFNENHRDSKAPAVKWFPIVLSIMLFFVSFLVTFETYRIIPQDVEGTFVLDNESSFFIMQDNNEYLLYENGEPTTVILPSIPDYLSHLPVY